MILGIGTDIVSTNRIERLLIKFGDKFEERIFTKKEILTAKKFKKDQHNPHPESNYYAKRFAAKEALSKAVGTGIGKDINFCDIEISNDKKGKPEIKLSKKAQIFICKKFKIKSFKIHLSLADESPLAQAFVVLEGL